MLEPEKPLDEALRAARAQARDQQRRRRFALGVLASYALDTLFLALYAYAGALPGAVPAAYGAGAALICAFQYLVYARGWNLQARDPNLTEPFILVAVAMNLGVIAAVPQITFPFLANQFTVFAFGMLWLSLRDSIMVWTLAALGLGVVLVATGARVGVAARTPFELLLTWGYFALIMGRCLILSVYANDMRARLAEGRQRLSASYEQLKVLASHDELTRTLNRRSLLAALERERSRAERSGGSFSVAMMDLDHFKSINDRHGHAAGDEVLRRFAAVALETKRVTDAFGRFGGEEFLVILVDIASARAVQATERIRVAVEAADWGSVAPGLSVTVSVGVAGYRKGETIEQLLHRADEALYAAKRAGRNRVMAETS